MNRILHLELSTGASGDKLLGALLEACESLGLARFEDLVRIGSSLVPGIEITRNRVLRSGIAASHLSVTEKDAPVRCLSDIRALIERAGDGGLLSQTAADRAISAFELVGRAEASVHDQPLDHVHFHEVGAADSILDIVGSCYLLDVLAPCAVYATPLALGYGSVICAHGELPVPAPATASIIEGLPVYTGVHEGELTTPTGAALVREFVTHFAPLPCSTIRAIGYGAGSREIPGAANVVRLLVGETDEAWRAQDMDTGSFTLEGCNLLESNIDHASPEALAFACDDLLRSGALDVWQEPITMKKGRLAVKLCLLCKPADARGLSTRVITTTGTLGVRMRYVERIIAPRASVTLDTPYGPVPFKVARFLLPDEPVSVQHYEDSKVAAWIRPEHDTVSTLARENGLEYQELYEELVNFGLNSIVILNEVVSS